MSANLFTASRSIPFLFLIFILNDRYIPVHTVEPRSLWIAIHATLQTIVPDCDKLDKKQCAKVVLYNDDSAEYIKGNFTGDNFTVINIDGNAPDGFMTKEYVDTINATVQKSRRYTRCIVVVSIVNTTKEVHQLEMESSNTMQDLKLKYSEEFTKMLQFMTPIQQRFLLLVRFGESETDFGQCHKRKVPYQSYPRRLVPIWEQALFDFFPFAKAVHAIRNEKLVATRREEGNLLWICDDVIKKLELEEDCKANPNDVCIGNMTRGDFSPVGFDVNNKCSGFKARM